MKTFGTTLALAALAAMIVLGLMKKRAAAGFCFSLACLGGAISQWGG